MSYRSINSVTNEVFGSEKNDFKIFLVLSLGGVVSDGQKSKIMFVKKKLCKLFLSFNYHRLSPSTILIKFNI
jgi:hypothetical protein